MTGVGSLRFRESQRFIGRRLGLALVLAGALAGAWGAWRIALEGPRMGGWPPALALLLVAVGVPAFFWAAELTVEVWPDRLEVRFPPFVKRRIPLNELRSARARRYRPLLEYGGWGVRHGLGGKAYNVRGDRGVQIGLASGESFLLGSQRADELAEALAETVRERYGRRLAEP